MEMLHLEALIKKFSSLMTYEILGEVKAGKEKFPLYALSIGSRDRSKPTFGIFGGVHGLERVGSQVAIHYLEHILELLRWDDTLKKVFDEARIVSIPIVNPGGMFLGKRSNPQDVDLMRNAPIEAQDPAFLLGGHTYSKWLPWYRGQQGQMEVESKAMVDFVIREMFDCTVSIALDLHSGFGARDRLWYPYAKTKDPFPDESKALALTDLLSQTYKHHVYLVEAQSMSYTTHGDLWDYLYDMHREKFKGERLFLPWTLEMGSWIWLRKNPPQLFTALGAFNPIKPHRHKRTMRRHMSLLDFLFKAVRYPQAWVKK